MNYTVLLWLAVVTLLFWVFYTLFLEMSCINDWELGVSNYDQIR
jgi:hypothetical protein